MPRKGLEPSRPLSHWHLKPARLPIPPPGPGRVSKDRSRACQIGELRAEAIIFCRITFSENRGPLFRVMRKYAVQRRRLGVSRIC